MEARVYFNDGRIEAHRIPDYVGNGTTVTQEYGGSETYNDIDRVRGIVERFIRDSEGYWIEQEVKKPVDARLSTDGTRLVKDKSAAVKRTRVVSSAELSNVKLILLDGEQVYPEIEEASIANDGYLDAVGF